MNKDQVKGTAKVSVGKMQREAGKLVGSRKQQAKGMGRQIEGEAQKRLGDIKDAVKTSRKANER
jgi:uncharacterized protein YjbJ (UPF0337 family)